MSKHDYSQSTVSNVSSTILNCKNAAQNTILSTESMSYSWDAGIIHNVVTWTEVTIINMIKSSIENMFKDNDFDFQNILIQIKQADSTTAEFLETGLTTLSAIKRKAELVLAFTKLYPTVSTTGCFDNLHTFINGVDEDIDKVRQSAKLDFLLSKLPKEHAEKLKSYVDNMEEPYKSIYLKTVDKYKIGNIVEDFSTEENETGFFSPYYNTINVDMNEEPVNPRGSYVTYFHESGHAIDYNFNDDGKYFTLTYHNKDGESLYDVLYMDVKNDIQKTISNYVVDETTKKYILDYIMSAGNSGSLSGDENRVLQQVQSDYTKKFAGAINESPSDVYGGVTGNIIVGSYRHSEYSYWYDTNGNSTYQQPKELWAEYYSYCAAGDKDNLEALSRYFPNAKKFMDEMAWEMAGFEDIK